MNIATFYDITFHCLSLLEISETDVGKFAWDKYAFLGNNIDSTYFESDTQLSPKLQGDEATLSL
jgi:hypothetical protein